MFDEPGAERKLRIATGEQIADAARLEAFDAKLAALLRKAITVSDHTPAAPVRQPWPINLAPAPAEEEEEEILELSDVAEAPDADEEPAIETPWLKDPEARLAQFGDVALDVPATEIQVEAETPAEESPAQVIAPVEETKPVVAAPVQAAPAAKPAKIKAPKMPSRQIVRRYRAPSFTTIKTRPTQAALELANFVRHNRVPRAATFGMIAAATALTACTIDLHPRSWGDTQPETSVATKPGQPQIVKIDPALAAIGTMTVNKDGVQEFTGLGCSKDDMMYIQGKYNTVPVKNNNICNSTYGVVPTSAHTITYNGGITLKANPDGTFTYNRDVEGTAYDRTFEITSDVMRGIVVSWAKSNSPQSGPFKYKMIALEAQFKANAWNSNTDACGIEQIVPATFLNRIRNEGQKLGLGFLQEKFDALKGNRKKYVPDSAILANKDYAGIFRAYCMDPEISGLVGESNREYLRLNAQTTMLSDGVTFADGRTTPYEFEMYLSHNQAKLAKAVFRAYQTNPNAPVSSIIKGGEYAQNRDLFEGYVNPDTGEKSKQVIHYSVKQVYKTLRKYYGFSFRGMQASFIQGSVPYAQYTPKRNNGTSFPSAEFQRSAVTDISGMYIVRPSREGENANGFWINPFPSAPWISQHINGITLEKVTDLSDVPAGAIILKPTSDGWRNRLATIEQYRAELAKAQKAKPAANGYAEPAPAA